MRNVKVLVAAGASLLLVSAAQAADLGMMPPPAPPPAPIAEFGGWYLRGDIGMSNQKVKSLYNVLYNAPGTSVTPQGMEFDSAPIFGAGIGYQFNSWLRADITGDQPAAIWVDRCLAGEEDQIARPDSVGIRTESGWCGVGGDGVAVQ